jgi:uncharacterized membrane protein YedE/YeeE
MTEWIFRPWPWYIGGPLIGLMVPALLLLGNRNLGVSSSLRHICAACLPAKISYFRYDWKKESWNLLFVGGIILGAYIATQFISNGEAVQVDPRLLQELQQYGVVNHDKLAPVELFNWPALLTLKGILLMVFGGFLVGFGTRYADGCTSGHSIMGLSNLQWPSLVATICFMIGGFVMANLILPIILKS